MLKGFVLVIDGSCALFLGGPYQITDRSILGGDKQLPKRRLEVVAETGLVLIMKRGLAHDAEIYRFGFVVVFKPPDLPFVGVCLYDITRLATSGAWTISR